LLSLHFFFRKMNCTIFRSKAGVVKEGLGYIAGVGLRSEVAYVTGISMGEASFRDEEWVAEAEALDRRHPPSRECLAITRWRSRTRSANEGAGAGNNLLPLKSCGNG
jgi:hypothetical protein